MKTTIEIPDDLLIQAKKRAAELRVPLRQLVVEGLRARLARTGAASGPRRPSIRWVTVAGGVPKGLDVADRAGMHEWLSGARR